MIIKMLKEHIEMFPNKDEVQTFDIKTQWLIPVLFETGVSQHGRQHS